MADESTLLAGVELGGTKCICILGRGPERIIEQVRIPTKDPATTLAAIERVLDRWAEQEGAIGAIGIASFGPVDLDPASVRYGSILATPKPGWRDTDLAGRMARRYGLPVGFNTDVTGAALAEARWGGAQGLDSLAYVTIGTGIGVGLVTRAQPVVGFSHPELGHLRIARAPGDDWPGSCPFHGDCIEGLASGSAIEARLGLSPDALPPDHPVWDLVAQAIGQLLHAIVVAVAPKRILIGGGVMQDHLFPAVRRQLALSLNHYVETPGSLESYIQPPALGSQAGPLGSLALAIDALGDSSSTRSLSPQ